MLDIINPDTLLLAAGAADTIDKFLKDGIGALLKGAMGIAGFLILLFAVFKAVKDILSGKIGGAVKAIAGGAIIAAMLLAPGETLGGLIDFAENIVTLFTDSADTVRTGTGGNSGVTG